MTAGLPTWPGRTRRSPACPRRQRRLGVLADWADGPHRLTCRQAEYTLGLVTRALGKDQPDGQPARELQRICDDLLEASVPAGFKNASSSPAVDWSDLETFSRPPPHGTSDCADPEASWGHRRNNLLHDEDELFFGYYLSHASTVPDEHGPPVPELARRMTVSSCRRDPVPAFTPVLTAMPERPTVQSPPPEQGGPARRCRWTLPNRHRLVSTCAGVRADAVRADGNGEHPRSPGHNSPTTCQPPDGTGQERPLVPDAPGPWPIPLPGTGSNARTRQRWY